MTTTSPRPSAPKPGQRPGKLPGAHPHPVSTASAPQHTPANDPAQWGRIDGDGTVYLKTTEGERIIGSWQAGTPEEGLAHFGQRYNDLVTEVELLNHRLDAHPQESAHIRHTAEELKAGLSEQSVLGDLAAVETRLSAIVDKSISTEQKVKEDREKRREEAIARKEQLAAEAEDIAENSTQWKEAGDRIREILEEWKTIHGVDRKTDDALWKRYSRARDSFNRRRGSHFAELDRSRAAARRKKEELVEKAQALQESTDWNTTAAAFRELMAEWKTAGRAPREVDDRLWEQFKAAQDHFFDARNTLNRQRDEEFAAHAAAKDALLEEYEPLIKPEENLREAQAKLHELQDKWEDIGYVPRNKVSEYEHKIAAIERRVEEAAKAQWRRTDPEAQERAGQFTAKVAELTKAAEAAEAQGNTKRAADLRAQAQQWQEWADTAAKAVQDR